MQPKSIGNVLSLFDGMSCGQLALNRSNIKYGQYFASEIDKPAQKVSKINFPNTIYIGDVRQVNVDSLPSIDLLIGGSPCQSFSFAGKRKGMATKDLIEILSLEQYLALKAEGFEFEGQSYLLWEYIRIFRDLQKKNHKIKFLLENVMMGSKWQKILTQAIGINPIQINSALVSAQNRERLYWTNIGARQYGFFNEIVCNIHYPKDRGIFLISILEDKSNIDKKYYLSDKAIIGHKIRRKKNQDKGNGFSFIPITLEEAVLKKSPTIVARYYKDGKECLIKYSESEIRKLTPVELERLQTVPDNYTGSVSDTQRGRMLGNGWNIETISHIFNYL